MTLAESWSIVSREKFTKVKVVMGFLGLGIATSLIVASYAATSSSQYVVVSAANSANSDSNNDDSLQAFLDDVIPRRDLLPDRQVLLYRTKLPWVKSCSKFTSTSITKGRRGWTCGKAQRAASFRNGIVTTATTKPTRQRNHSTDMKLAKVLREVDLLEDDIDWRYSIYDDKYDACYVFIGRIQDCHDKTSWWWEESVLFNWKILECDFPNHVRCLKSWGEWFSMGGGDGNGGGDPTPTDPPTTPSTERPQPSWPTRNEVDNWLPCNCSKNNDVEK